MPSRGSIQVVVQFILDDHFLFYCATVAVFATLLGSGHPGAPMERRLKRFTVSEREIRAYLNRFSDPDHIVIAVNVTGPPEGFVVHRVHYDSYSDGWQLLIHHPSFPEVPEGEVVPVAMEWADVERIALQRGTDGAYRSKPFFLKDCPVETLRAMRDEINQILYDRERTRE